MKNLTLIFVFILIAVQTNATVRTLSGGGGGQYSDFNAAYKKTRNDGLQTGIRFAFNPAVIKGKYKYGKNESPYSPKIGWRQYNLSILVKLFSKTYFRR